jgi:hypothetical protein
MAGTFRSHRCLPRPKDLYAGRAAVSDAYRPLTRFRVGTPRVTCAQRTDSSVGAPGICVPGEGRGCAFPEVKLSQAAGDNTKPTPRQDCSEGPLSLGSVQSSATATPSKCGLCGRVSTQSPDGQKI